MTRRRLHLPWLAAGLALLAGAAPAKRGADPKAPAEPARPAAAASRPAPAEPEAKPRTGAELQAQAAKDLLRIRGAVGEVLARMDDARQEKDLDKLICADEKLQRIKHFLTVAERADVALAEAIARADAGAEIESTKISIARAKVDLVRNEAASCIGQLAWKAGIGTEVTVEEPDDRGLRPALDRIGPALDAYRVEFGIPSTKR